MGFLDMFKTKNTETNNETNSEMIINEGSGIHKAYIPEFLYKPPFGYPRKDNVVLMRELAKNPYIYSVVKTLCDEAASTPYDIVPKKDVDMTPELEAKRTEILNFFDNPNSNKESFKQIIRMVVKDVCEVDAGLIVKAYNEFGEFKEIYARDGGSFLLNPDIYGYLGNRTDYVEPIPINYYSATPSSGPDWQATMNAYSLAYKETAAYFQYGVTGMALPVPFGKKEVIYIKQNPQSNNIYGVSPIQILADIITTLVYGSAYNLDFYMNNNMPEGIIQLIGMKKENLKGFQQRMQKQIRVKDPKTGFWRKIGFKVPAVNVEAKFTPFQLDPKVMQIIEQQDWFSRLVWACFGITADEMGFTDKSNKAVSAAQGAVYKRKAVRPILGLLKVHFDKEIITEFGEDLHKSLEFKWDDYDLEEDAKKHSLLEQEIRMGIKTPEMVADELGIDTTVLEASMTKKEEKEMEKFEQQNQLSGFDKEEQFPNKNPDVKAIKYENDLEKELVTNLKQKSKEIINSIKKLDKSELDKIQ